MKYPTPALWRVQVISAHDGDTIRCLVDRGIDEMCHWDIRLKDVFAPELKQTGGMDCRDHLLGWLHDHDDDSDWPYQLETFRTPKSDIELMTFNRYVGVLTDPNGLSLNVEMQTYISAHQYPGGIGS